jgi:hypothetical protein
VSANPIASSTPLAAGAQQVRFHRSLYAPEAVEEAVRAFADLATLTVMTHPEDVLVVIEHAHASVSNVIADELANFALSETVARSREVNR